MINEWKLVALELLGMVIGLGLGALIVAWLER